MRPSLLPRLVNSPFDDPALFIQFLFENKAVLFDLGEIGALSTRDVLKLTHVFVTHTHMDHFIGFDRLLRLFLGRNKNLKIYGPRGFIQNVEGKLAGYQWNLVDNFSNRFNLQVVEVRNRIVLSKTFACHKRFKASRQAVELPFTNPIAREPAFNVSAAILDHRIPCLGLSMQEHFHVNIKKDALQRMQLSPGPWLNRFKEALYCGSPPQMELTIPCENGERRFALGALADEIAVISPGQKITYIADAVYSDNNVKKVISLAKDSDHLFMEAAFSEQHAGIAADKHHLTARQSGQIAALACARRFTPFHFSPRYADTPDLLRQEAEEAFKAGLRT